MKPSSACFLLVSTFMVGMGVHILFLMPFVTGILTDVPPIPYRWWNLASNIVNWFFITVWAVAVPLNLYLIAAELCNPIAPETPAGRLAPSTA